MPFKYRFLIWLWTRRETKHLMRYKRQRSEFAGRTHDDVVHASSRAHNSWSEFKYARAKRQRLEWEARLCSAR